MMTISNLLFSVLNYFQNLPAIGLYASLYIYHMFELHTYIGIYGKPVTFIYICMLGDGVVSS